MKYTIDINRNIEALTESMKMVSEIYHMDEWRVLINAGGIDYGIYFNFDLEQKELEISNQPSYGYDDSLLLEEIIEKINSEYSLEKEWEECFEELDFERGDTVF